MTARAHKTDGMSDDHGDESEGLTERAAESVELLKERARRENIDRWAKLSGDVRMLPPSATGAGLGAEYFRHYVQSQPMPEQNHSHERCSVCEAESLTPRAADSVELLRERAFGQTWQELKAALAAGRIQLPTFASEQRAREAEMMPELSFARSFERSADLLLAVTPRRMTGSEEAALVVLQQRRFGVRRG